MDRLEDLELHALADERLKDRQIGVGVSLAERLVTPFVPADRLPVSETADRHQPI